MVDLWKFLTQKPYGVLSIARDNLELSGLSRLLSLLCITRGWSIVKQIWLCTYTFIRSSLELTKHSGELQLAVSVFCSWFHLLGCHFVTGSRGLTPELWQSKKDAWRLPALGIVCLVVSLSNLKKGTWEVRIGQIGMGLKNWVLNYRVASNSLRIVHWRKATPNAFEIRADLSKIAQWLLSVFW